MIFKAVGEGRPYPEHGLVTPKDWSAVAPRQVRLDQLVTTRAHLDLHSLLSSDSTFFGDLFAHVVRWQGGYYLEDGLHRALRAALQQRTVIHARVLDLDDPDHPTGTLPATTGRPGGGTAPAPPTADTAEHTPPVRTPLGESAARRRPPVPPPPPPPPSGGPGPVHRPSLAERRRSSRRP